MNQQQFLALATNIKNDTFENRQMLLDKFDIVHNNVECAHDESEAYYMANHILYNQHIPGPLIEFGCYKCGMSAKLSHVAKLVDKQLILYDSFVGLLDSANYESQPGTENILTNFETGMYASTMQEATDNLINYGEHTYCSFAVGTIEKLLPILIEIESNHPSFVFIDVDIIDTCLFIIKNIWNKTTTELLFVHESCILDMMNSLSDYNFWQNNFGTNVPTFGHNFYNTLFSLPNTNCLNFIAKPNVLLDEMFLLNNQI